MALVGIALALGLGACGGGSGSDSSSTSDSTSTSTSSAQPTITSAPEPPEKAPAKANVPSCASQLGGFLDELNQLRRNLVIGVSYEQYVAELGTVRRGYGKLPVDQLDFACLAGAASIAEESFDGYLAAANTWGDCVSESGCETATLEPKLQRKWRNAAKQLREAQQAAEAPSGASG